VQPSLLAITLPSAPTIVAVPLVSNLSHERPVGATTSTDGPPEPACGTMREVNA
jgi:hypothetical protein